MKSHSGTKYLSLFSRNTGLAHNSFSVDKSFITSFLICYFTGRASWFGKLDTMKPSSRGNGWVDEEE